MSILLLFTSSQLGGAERSLTRMVMLASHEEYVLATLDGEGPWSLWVRDAGMEPLVFGQRKRDGRHGSFGHRELLKVVRYVRSHKVDVIYIIGFRSSCFLRLLRFLMPGVFLIQGVRWNPVSDSMLDNSFRNVERFFHSLIDGYITNSRVAAETLIQRCKVPACRVQVIYNGVAELPKDVPPLEIRPPEVLTVANISPRKGHCEYLRAVRLVLNAVPEARFVFVGRDDMNGEIELAVEEAGLSHAVSCEGFQADVSVYFRSAKVSVLPSLWGEGCPTSLLESFSWGVPVVAYDVDGVAELIEDGVDGFLVSTGDSELLAERIITLLSDVKLSKHYGQAGKKKIFEKFSLSQCVTRHTRYFCDLKGCE